MELKWLDAEAASKHLGISMSNLYSMAQSGRVPAHRVGKVWRFDIDELDAWIRIKKPIDEFFLSVDFDIEENLFLREPQREAYLRAYDFFSKSGKKAIIQLPVGCGKSGLIAILPLGISKGRVLVIAPNLTIKDELSRTLDISRKQSCFWHKCKVMSAESMTAGPYLAILDSSDSNIHDCDNSHFVLTNIQQLATNTDRWLSQFSEDYFDMILVDEGHHSAALSWVKVFEKFPNAKVVNLTATPFRSDQKDIEGEMIYKYAFKSAMIKGYIKTLQARYISPSEIYFTYKGDSKHYTLEDVMALREEEWFSRGVALSPVCNEHIVDASLERLDELRKTGTRHQLIAVACSVEHARQIRSLYAERGYSAAAIHSKMASDEQEKVKQELRAGILDCIIQVQMLGEGFDHPKLSTAAIFRPFRSLPPYVQFIGRIMRVIVQNQPFHPDNWGYIVTHIGLNLDQQMQDFREMDSEDQKFFKKLIAGEEPEVPEEVLNGDARMRVSEPMVVHNEIIENFLEEDFINPEDEVLTKALELKAEELGFDTEGLVEFLQKKKKERIRTKSATAPFPVNPQRKRQEARRRLNESVRRNAKILLNRLGLRIAGRELQLNYGIAISGSNLVVAVQLINHEVNKHLGIEGGERAKLRTDDYLSAIKAMDDIVNTLTRRLKKGEKNANS